MTRYPLAALVFALALPAVLGGSARAQDAAADFKAICMDTDAAVPAARAAARARGWAPASAALKARLLDAALQGAMANEVDGTRAMFARTEIWAGPGAERDGAIAPTVTFMHMDDGGLLGSDIKRPSDMCLVTGAGDALAAAFEGRFWPNPEGDGLWMWVMQDGRRRDVRSATLSMAGLEALAGQTVYMLSAADAVDGQPASAALIVNRP